LIIVGLQQPLDPEGWSRSIAALADYLKAPVLADSLNPIRHHRGLNPNLVSSYDAILRNPLCAAELRADRVWCIGELPTSKVLRQWLVATDPELIFVDPSGDNFDPLHGRSSPLLLTPTELLCALRSTPSSPPSSNSGYLDQWPFYNQQYREFINIALRDRSELCEAKIPWILSQYLPLDTPIFIANSTPIRDVEWFWQPSDRRYRPYFNRGTNGIDGTLSTAIGLAHNGPPTVLLTGDLALLHDSNGALIRPQLKGHLTIVLVNNNGGGIFELLPIAQHEPPFEIYFGTPQNIDFQRFCATYSIDYVQIESWQHLRQEIEVLPESGIRVLEIRTDRKAEAKWRMALFRGFEGE
jgi:2-succinyl-5-enolpyruvyl-6-hydroxy-3-cyclohexene-1-carboxylate synthase